MAEIYVQLQVELRREVVKKLVDGELKDVADWCWDMREAVEMVNTRDTKEEAEVVAENICDMMGDEEFGVCISKKYRHWRVWLKALGFDWRGMRKYRWTIHVFKNHYYDYGFSGSLLSPVMKIMRGGSYMESRVYWDKQFMELERVKKNLVEMEKVIRGFDGEINM